MAVRQELYDQLKKKLEKKEEEYTDILVGNKTVCRKCRKPYKANTFLKATDTILDTNNLMSICKNCVNEEFDANYNRYENDMERSLLETCKTLNVAYHPMAVDQTKSHIQTFKSKGKNVKAVFGIYVSKLFTVGKKNGISHFTYTGSSNEENTGTFESSKEKEIAKLQDEFGYGYDKDEYLNFQRKRKKLSLGYGEKTALHTEWFYTFIVWKVKSEMSAAKGDVASASKWQDMADKAATAGKLKVSQLSKSDVTGGIDLVPQLAEAVEDRVSLIPIMKKMKEIPYDDADMIIWALTSKTREDAGLGRTKYVDTYGYFKEMTNSYFEEKGLTKSEILLEEEKRNSVFRDLDKIYYEPLYDDEV
jgi:hypothetical protein